MLVLKGRQDYQETMNCWKQTDHVLGILLESQDRPKKSFLQKFYEGESLFDLGGVGVINVDFLILVLRAR